MSKRLNLISYLGAKSNLLNFILPKLKDVLITNYDIKQEGDNYVKDNQFNSSCNEFNNSNIECYTG